MNDELLSYIEKHIDAEPALLRDLNRQTHVSLLRPRMLSGHLQGRVLKMLCRMIQPKNILELGTFSGYSALSMAEALPEDGMLHTIEIDDELEEFILQFISKSPDKEKIKLHIGDAKKIIPQLDCQFDLVFLDADKRQYIEHYELVLPKVRSGGFILADNTLWDGKVLEQPHHTDKQTIGILEFNEHVAQDTRVEKIILPLRDGLTIMWKK